MATSKPNVYAPSSQSRVKFATWAMFVGSVLVAASPLYAQRDRLTSWIRHAERVPLRGSLHPMAQPQFDQGPVASDFVLESMMMGFKKTEEQQTALDELLDDLQDPRSPRYHQWLTPEQYAERFGVSQADIAKITEWLALGGFHVLNVSPSRDMIMFSGTAHELETVVGTPIHRYRANGREFFANAAAPSVPKDMVDLVAGIHGLHNFGPNAPRRRRASGKVPGSTADVMPRLADTEGDNLLAPDDLATIYNLGRLHQAGVDGSGQKIAIAGMSDIDMADIEAFRRKFNLPFNDPRPVLVPRMKNPGRNEGMVEADLDLEWAGAIAPKAELVYVFSRDLFASAFYAIDQVLAPVLSTSFGICEWHLLPDDAGFLRTYSQKAAAFGITWVASSGDSGAAGCEAQGGAYTFATTRLSVPMPASLPEVTAVGGTEFREGSGSYWSRKPGPNSGTALSYIPEAAWNDEDAIVSAFSNGFLGTMGWGFASGGGGASIYWSKPPWQAGPGVPNDEVRDVPDVSLNASGSHDPYVIMTQGGMEAIGGTSASAPVFAGILALLNHYLVGTKVQSRPGLGNINPMLYYLGRNAPDVYHDITVGSNVVPCVPGSSPDCPQNGVYGYYAGFGYDLVTGWGSVDATRLVATWANVVSNTARLVVTSFTTSTQTSVGGQINVIAKVANQGNVDAGPFQIRILFTSDGTPATAKPWYVFCDMKGASPGQTVSCGGTATLDRSITARVYTPIAIADYNNQVPQYDRSGNISYSAGGTLTVQ